MCDLIAAADDAFFADPVVRMGLPGVEYFARPRVMGVVARDRLCDEVTATDGKIAAPRFGLAVTTPATAFVHPSQARINDVLNRIQYWSNVLSDAARRKLPHTMSMPPLAVDGGGAVSAKRRG